MSVTVDMNDMASRVKRGAALLDEKRPGWARGINLGRLEVRDCHQCILGQVYGGYACGMIKVGVKELPPWETPPPGILDSTDHGFCAKSHKKQSEYLILAACWRAEVLTRTTEAVPC